MKELIMTSCQGLRRFNHRRGVTLADVFVSIGVIGIIAALIVPAVQQARENSRVLQCRSNLKQLGLASQSHLATKAEQLPYTATNAIDSRGRRLLASISPHRNLLEFLGYSTLAERLRLDSSSVNDTQYPPTFHDAAVQELLSVRISVFLCPSDVQRPGATNYRSNMGFGPGLYAAGRRAIGGFNGNVSGAFVHGRSTRPSEFSDGLSNTILFSEKLIGDGDPSNFAAQRDFFFASNFPITTADDAIHACGPLARPGSMHASYCGWTWIFGGWNSTWYNHVLPPNSKVSDCSAGTYAMAGGGSGAYSARSLHTGGVIVVSVDGSARFVSSQIDLAVWRNLSSRREINSP
ncbi:MAG: DUF1559 domain-containing protein [Planctomycetaceae bacterium]